MEIVNKDILEIKRGIICHQVNCKGVMGAGLAKSIRKKWPEVYNSYMKVCTDINSEQLLGRYQLIEVSDQLYVCNLFGQYGYGRMPGKSYTDYTAFESSLLGLCMSDVAKNGLWVYLPYKIGCGLAGGNWHVVKSRIEATETRSNTKIYICKHI